MPTLPGYDASSVGPRIDRPFGINDHLAMRWHRKIFALFVGSMISAVAGQADATGNHRRRHRRPPLQLRIDSPASRALVFGGGWRLAFSVRPRDASTPIFIERTRLGGGYPEPGVRAAFVLRDRDGCPHFSTPSACPDIPGDEVLMRFAVDSQRPSGAGGTTGWVPSTLIREVQGLPLEPSFEYFGAQGDLASFDPDLEPDPGDTFPPPQSLRYHAFSFGPFPAPGSGLRYGFNDDLPGLVVLSDVGVGRVMNPRFGGPGDPPPFSDTSRLARRNLAGMLTDVQFELRGGRRPRSSVVRASMDVPAALFAKHQLVDECWSASLPTGWLGPFCVGGALATIDEGNPAPTVDVPLPPEQGPDLAQPGAAAVELRAFIVDGFPPKLLVDCDGDGDVDASDARCLGLDVLSNEVVLNFVQYGVSNRFLGLNPVGDWGDSLAEVSRFIERLFDFDGTGYRVSRQAPSGGGGVKTPPM